MSTDSIIVLSAFVAYLILMIVIGILSMKKTKSTREFDS